MIRPDLEPWSLRRIELAAGLGFMTSALLVLLYSIVSIVNSECSTPAVGAMGGCWNGPSGYFVVLGVLLFVVGLFWSIVGGLRRGRIHGSSSPNLRAGRP